VPGELVILVGLQASGKTGFYRQRFAATHAHVSKDLMPRSARNKETRQLDQVERALASGASVVLDNTNPRAADRAALVAIAHRHGARAVAYFFPPQVADSIRRNAARTPSVPKVAIFTTLKKLQPPTWAEGFDEISQVRLAEDGSFSVVPLAR
jgi:predicted kinase